MRCAACVTLYFFHLAIMLFGYRRLAWLFPTRVQAPPDTYARRVVEAVQAAARLGANTSCLAQACAGRAMFAWRGYAVTMRVGVRQAGEGQMAAHAWLLAGDQVILGASVEEFQQYRPIADFN